MSTRLSAFCDRLIEGSWLSALIVTPLFFNLYSSRTFEPDKHAILRSMTLLMALAWLIKGLEAWSAGATPWRQPSWAHWWAWLRANPLVSFVLLLGLDALLATCLSVMPRISFWGSYARLQGLYTSLAYWVIFVSIVALLRTAAQVQRLISTALMVSIPVALYGLMQYFGNDPLPWSGIEDALRRTTSTVGNVIFVAAFLIMVVPLTLYRLLEARRLAAQDESLPTQRLLTIGGGISLALQMVAWWFDPRTGTLVAVTIMGLWLAQALVLGKSPYAFVRLGYYTVLLSLQLSCIIFTQSRGPWLGLLGGLGLFVLLRTLVQQQWRRAVLCTVAGLAAALLLLLLMVPHSPLEAMRQLPYVERLSHSLDSPTSRVRIWLWQGAAELAAARPWRTLLGYGPETLPSVYAPYRIPELHKAQPNVSVDRSHNETFDILLTTGIVGVGLHILLITGICLTALRYLGLVGTGRQQWCFLGLWLGGGTLAVVLVWVVDSSWRFLGIALPIGMLLGLFTYLGGYGLYGLRSTGALSTPQADRPQALLVAAIVAALMSHFIEIQVGIAIAATRTYFWAYAALVAIAGHLLSGAEHRAEAPTDVRSAPTPSRRQRRRDTPRALHSDRQLAYRALISGSLLVCVIMMTLLVDFISPMLGRAHWLGLLWLFAFTWGFAALMVLTETPSPPAGMVAWRRLAGTCGVYVALTLIGATAFGVIQWRLVSSARKVTFLLLAYVVGLFLMLCGIAWSFPRKAGQSARPLCGRLGIVYPLLVVATLGLALRTNLYGVWADMYYKQGRYGFYRQGQYAQAIAAYRRAQQFAPREEVYAIFLGSALLEEARRATIAGRRTDLLQQAEEAFNGAHHLHPLIASPLAGLAQLHRLWAQRSVDPEDKAAHFQRALAFHAQAQERDPNNPQLWVAWAHTLHAQGNVEAALDKYQQALRLDNTSVPANLGLGDIYSARGQWPQAAQAYEAVVARNKPPLQAHSALGTVYTKMGRYQEALQQFQLVLKSNPNDWLNQRNLASLYYTLGQPQLALTHARLALQGVPEAERALLEAFIRQLQASQSERNP